MKKEAIIELLHGSGMKATPQRVEIIDYIFRNNHSSAAEIKEHTDKVLPSVSFSTIYLTVNTLVEAGTIIPITLEPGVVRYDTNTSPHYHIICIECGSITEVPIDPFSKFPISEFREFGFSEILGFGIHFFGICDKCAG